VKEKRKHTRGPMPPPRLSPADRGRKRKKKKRGENPQLEKRSNQKIKLRGPKKPVTKKLGCSQAPKPHGCRIQQIKEKGSGATKRAGTLPQLYATKRGKGEGST